MIEDKDIIRTAQQLRDEQNAKLLIRPWNRHSHFRIPTWLVAIPAAAVIGFVLGIWTNSDNAKDAPLTALVDTIYIKVPEKVTEPDSIAHTDIKLPDTSTISPSVAPAKTKAKQPTPGHSIADDNIRYDLLVKN